MMNKPMYFALMMVGGTVVFAGGGMAILSLFVSRGTTLFGGYMILAWWLVRGWRMSQAPNREIQ